MRTIMKHLFKAIFFMIFLLALTSCTPKQSSSNNSNATGDDTSTSDIGETDPTDSPPSIPPPTNCTGTTADGQGIGNAIHQYSLIAAGHQSWMPGTYEDPLAQQTMPKIIESTMLFRSDSKLKIRLKVNSQPFPTAGEEYCFGRVIGQPSDAFKYTKLRYRIHLRDILCETPNPLNPSECLTELKLGDRYRTQFIEPTNVGSCSQILDLGSIRNSSVYGTTIEIDDVKSDSTCQANDTRCPAEQIVRAASCWHMTLQIATDFTQDFKD